MFGRTLGGATVATFQGILVMILATIVGFRFDVGDVLPGLVFMILVSLLFTALGTGIASILEDMQGFQLIMNFVVMPVFFLSGALFPLDTAPVALKWIAVFNPLAYGVDGLRHVFLGMSHYGIWTDFSVLALITAAFIAIGAWLFSRIKA
jgi:ABC-2 type transport system permease protein